MEFIKGMRYLKGLSNKKDFYDSILNFILFVSSLVR